MTVELMILVGLALVILVVIHALLWVRLKEAERLIDRTNDQIRTNYHAQRDDYHHLNHKHKMLIEALDLVEAPPTRTRYVKKGNA